MQQERQWTYQRHGLCKEITNNTSLNRNTYNFICQTLHGTPTSVYIIKSTFRNEMCFFIMITIKHLKITIIKATRVCLKNLKFNVTIVLQLCFNKIIICLFKDN